MTELKPTKMKTYKSIRNLEFDNVLACALDNQSDKTKFIELWRFLFDFDYSAIAEWCNVRNFKPYLEHIIQTLTDVDVLK
jgi:hypothetical protein